MDFKQCMFAASAVFVFGSSSLSATTVTSMYDFSLMGSQLQSNFGTSEITGSLTLSFFVPSGENENITDPMLLDFSLDTSLLDYDVSDMSLSFGGATRFGGGYSFSVIVHETTGGVFGPDNVNTDFFNIRFADLVGTTLFDEVRPENYTLIAGGQAAFGSTSDLSVTRVSVVPVPLSGVLLGSGFLGLGLIAGSRRRNRETPALLR